MLFLLSPSCEYDLWIDVRDVWFKHFFLQICGCFYTFNEIHTFRLQRTRIMINLEYKVSQKLPPGNKRICYFRIACLSHCNYLYLLFVNIIISEQEAIIKYGTHVVITIVSYQLCILWIPTILSWTIAFLSIHFYPNSISKVKNHESRLASIFKYLI